MEARAPARLADWRGDALDADTTRLEAEYFRRLSERVDQWIADNPDAAAELERATRSDLGLIRPDTLSEFQRRAVREQMLVQIRTANKWPESDQWIAQQRVKAMGPGNEVAA